MKMQSINNLRVSVSHILSAPHFTAEWEKNLKDLHSSLNSSVKAKENRSFPLPLLLFLIGELYAWTPRQSVRGPCEQALNTQQAKNPEPHHISSDRFGWHKNHEF